MGKLDGKTAVITGGGSGIGLAVAERFTDEGTQTVLVGRRKSRLDEAAAQIGRGAYGVSADVADTAQVKAVFESLPRVDLLVTCAGGAVFGAVDELDPGAWRELFEARFFGQLYACHYAVPKMPEGAVILLCSGIAGRIGFAGQVCISTQRVLVDRRVYGDFLDATTPKVAQIKTASS